MPIQPIPTIVEEQIMAVVNGTNYTHTGLGVETITAGNNNINSTEYGSAYNSNYYNVKISSPPYDDAGNVSLPSNDGADDMVFLFMPASLHNSDPLLRNTSITTNTPG